MKKILKTIPYTILILLVTCFLTLQPAAVLADTTALPTPPTQPTAPTQPTPPTQPTAPTAPSPASQAQSTTTPTPTAQSSQTTDPTTTPTQNTAATPNDPSTTNNGAASQNNTTENTANTATNTQQNNGQSTAAVTQNSTTGQNNASDNVGNSTVTSQDANATGTIVNGVNTNLNNVSVSQFNIANNYTGDIILNFPANCVLNCGTGSNVTTAGNGAASTANTALTQTTGTTTNQNNSAAVGNTLSLHANSGNNISSQNTDGSTTVTSGNANVDANSLAFANNNLSGNVVFGVVNIYGNLSGDIILPQSALDAACGNSCYTGVNTSGNGAGSTNGTTVQNNSSAATNQQNQAGITNTIKTDATTGGNSTGENTNGNNSITTGQSNVNANSLTLANNNLDGGVWWLVLINDHGNWSGQLIGGNGNVASSQGLNFNLGPSGNIATTDNGAAAKNTTTVTDNNTTVTNQTNTAALNNTLDLSANTGGNTADQNTGGPSTIHTGNANILANLVDFANNNLTHGAKLIVTIVNVFGSWVGDFVAPGSHKSAQTAASSQPAAQTTTTTSTPLATDASQKSTGSLITAPTAINVPSQANAVFAAPWIPTTTVLAAQTAGTQQGINQGVKFARSDTPVKAMTNSVDINLAWLVFLLPFLAVLNVGRKRLRH